MTNPADEPPLYGITNGDGQLTVTDRVATRSRWITIDANDAVEVRR